MSTRIKGFLSISILLGSSALIGQEFEYSITRQNAKVLNQFIQAAKNKDKRTMAALFKFPLRRHYPIPPVRNSREMLQRFDHVFDQKLINKIAKSTVDENWNAVGWRGIMLNNGDLWADNDGFVYVINNQSKFESELQTHLMNKERSQLHPSLRDYDEPVLIAQGKRRMIRIDNKGNGYRYIAWAVGSKQVQKPDLVIENGTLDVQGTMRFHTYEFKSGSYSYVFEKEDAVLLVFKGKKEILKAVMQLVEPFEYVPGRFKKKYRNYQLRDI